MATLEKPRPKLKKRSKHKCEESEEIIISQKPEESLESEQSSERNIEQNEIVDRKISENIDKLALEATHDVNISGNPEEIIDHEIQTETENSFNIVSTVSSEVETSKDSFKDKVELNKVNESCVELSQAVNAIIQPLPLVETSKVNVEASTSKQNTNKPKTYQELATSVGNTIKNDLNMLSRLRTPLAAFTIDEIKNLFGAKEIEIAAKYACEFERNELQPPSSTHPLYEALIEFQGARSSLILNQRDVKSLMSETDGKLNSIWHIQNCVERVGGRCADGCYLEETHVYQVATLQKLLLLDLQKKLALLREKATELHSQHSHLEYFLKYKIDDLLWVSSVNGVGSMRTSLRIIFWVLRTSGWGYDKALRMQLRRWCCSLAAKLLEADDSLENLLFLTHHILRVSRGIKWSFHLINCKIKNWSDISKVLCLLDAIVYAGDVVTHDDGNSSQRQRHVSEGVSSEFDVVMGADAMDDNVWFVVDSDGEGADLEADGRGRGLLTEVDVLGLLKQIPFEEVFKELMVVRSDGNELIFCGGNLNGGPIIKILTSLRMILKTLNAGLATYNSYNEVSKELCRIALHCIKYFTDLWKVASKNCEPQLLERVLIEYNSLFIVTWCTIGSSGCKESIPMFQSEMPFHLVWLETIERFYNSVDKELKVCDNISCYYSLVCISNMAADRAEEEFVLKAIRRLYMIGFASDFSTFGCGEWARTLCGTALKSQPRFIGPLLAEVPIPRQPQWLESLPLSHWKPQTGELLYLLNLFKQSVSTTVIPYVLKGMDWSKNNLDYQTHKAVALFLVTLTRQLDQPKGQYTEWIWECILPLKLHMYDWNYDINSIPEPESVTELDLSGKCHASNVLSLLMTTWGHSVPLIYQNAASVLLRLANAGRLGEVIHALYYIVPVLSECPESISDCKEFKELLAVINRNEKTYTKMASRLVAGETVGPVSKQLVAMMQSQLKHYALFRLTCPRDMLMVWVYWLTSADGWQSDWLMIHLLDVALGSCFLHHPSVSTAAIHLAGCIQNMTAKSPTSSSSGFSWLWNSNTYKGLVQCSIEAPYVWHATLWTEHSTMERGTGLWPKLVTKLANHKEGTKINIDKALKSVGCSDSSSILVIYRCAQYGTSMSVSHPIFTLIWQLFFCLYLDVSFLQFHNKKPVGPLFFQGMVNSRLLAKIRLKLIEARTYHENKVAEFSQSANGSQQVENERQWYHESQKNLMSAFLRWLKEDISEYLDASAQSQSLPFYDKFSMLLAGNNAIWMDTVDFFQLNSFRPALWPLPMMPSQNHQSSTPSSLLLPQSRHKSPDTDPGVRIIHRLKSYEKPLVKSDEYGGTKLTPLVDPNVGRDFNAVVNLMQFHLSQVEISARTYNEACKSLNSTDNNLYDMVQNLYEKRQVTRSVRIGCGDSCRGKVQLNISVSNWKKSSEVIKMMDYNRTMYKLGVEDVTLPYVQMASHTAVVSKLATMACEGKIVNAEENGPKMFNIVIDYVKEDIINFPTAHHIIICFATQLGEKFVTQSGEHFINLVCKVRGPEGVGLVGALLRPCQLSTSDMIRVYSAISSTVTDYHIAFSYLTKFDIARWLHNARPSVSERSKFLNLLFNSLGTAGIEPSDERLMLHELMCIHLTKVMAWEFPVHLVQVLTAMCNLSLEKKIPPDTWQHCITIIETYPNMLTNNLACECLQLVGNLWWSKRGSWGPNGLYGQYGIYCTQMGRLGALLVSTVLSTAMLYNPPLLTKDICGIVLKAMQTFWNVWLCPWWGGGTQASVWVGELCRGPALMPWAPLDDVHPDTMLDAFVETILYCATTLPGSLNDLLCLVWQWYANNFPHPAVNPHILVRIHRALSKLPWTANTSHWLTLPDLRLLIKVTSLNIDTCNEFAVKCLGERSWVHWTAQQPSHTHALAVHHLLPMLLKLKPSNEVLEDAEFLPWGLLSIELYEENVNWFMRMLHTGTEPMAANRLLRLLCAAGGLTERSRCGDVWRIKRKTLIRFLINIICNDESNSCVDSVKFLLDRIQLTVDTLENSSDSQRYVEATHITESALLMFSMIRDTKAIQKVWCDGFKIMSMSCVSAAVSSLLTVTKRDVFACLAEEALLRFFELNGDWSFILLNWKDGCAVAVDYLLNSNALLTAIATYKATNRNDKVLNSGSIHPIDKAALQTLYTMEIELSCEKSASLWICYIISATSDHTLDRANTFAVVNQAITILEKWGQEPSWKFFKAMRLVQNNAPSHRFRLLARFALCFILDYQHKIKESTASLMSFDGNLRSKTVSSIESMVNQKSCVDIKHIIVKYLEVFKEFDRTIKDSCKYIIEMCFDLYNDVNYVKNMNSLFDTVL